MALSRSDVEMPDPARRSKPKLAEQDSCGPSAIVRKWVLAEIERSPRRVMWGVISIVAVIAGAIWLASAPGGARGLPSSRADLGVSQTSGSLPVAVEVPPISGPQIWVHVAGSVVSPGVYSIEASSRVKDAVAAAGGPTGDAELGAINLAAAVSDGDQVYVPSRTDPASGGAPQAQPGANKGAPAKPGSAKVNINKADAAQLETLPGVGPSTAEKIVAYRKANGPFRSVDELTRVSGIGEAKLSQMAPHIAVS